MEDTFDLLGLGEAGMSEDDSDSATPDEPAISDSVGGQSGDLGPVDRFDDGFHHGTDRPPEPSFEVSELDPAPDQSDMHGWEDSGAQGGLFEHWHQQTDPVSCAVVTQGAILEDVLGVPFDEHALEAFAQQQGWYDPRNGTWPNTMGNILEAYGVPCTRMNDASIDDVVQALDRGDKVMVGLDASEIYLPLHEASTGMPIEQSDAGHAVWVTGIDQDPDGSIHVILNDPGRPDGRSTPVEIHDFLNGWRTSETTLSSPIHTDRSARRSFPGIDRDRGQRRVA